MEQIPKFHVISSRADPPHTLYTVQGDNDKKAEYKYKDFEALREKIAEKWPGIYVPGIEPKKAKTKNENKRAMKILLISIKLLFLTLMTLLMRTAMKFNRI